MQNQTKVQHQSISVFLFSWVVFAAVYIFLKNYTPLQNIAGIPLSVAVIGSIIVAFIYGVRVWRKSTGKAKLVFGFFVLSFLCILIYGSIYQVVFNVLHLTQVPLPSLATLCYETIYFGFLVFQLLAWMCLFPKIDSAAKNRKDMVLYIPLAIILLYTFSMYIIIVKLEIFSYDSLYNILGFSSFILAMLCLASARNKGIFYLALGFLVSKSGGLIMISGTFAQKFRTGSPMETLWILGVLIMAYGLMNFKPNEICNTSPNIWIHPINSIRTQISFWIFALFMLSAFICFAIYYLATSHFLLQTTKDLQLLFPALCIYSVITVLSGKFFADKISLLLKKIEEEISSSNNTN